MIRIPTPSHENRGKEPGISLRICVLNVSNLFADESSFKTLKQALKQCRPDVCCFMKCVFVQGQNSFQPFLKSLSKDLGMSFVFTPDEGKSIGNAILSKWPILDSKNCNCATNTNKVASMISAEIQIQNRNVWVFLTRLHIPKVAHVQFRQMMKNLVEEIHPDLCFPHLICGYLGDNFESSSKLKNSTSRMKARFNDCAYDDAIEKGYIDINVPPNVDGGKNENLRRELSMHPKILIHKSAINDSVQVVSSGLVDVVIPRAPPTKMMTGELNFQIPKEFEFCGLSPRSVESCSDLHRSDL